ncbi:MAG: hypothetical protein A4E72_01578 [Syntrophus sp. PtaU1.Bin208]|nr:MAG: hypothetical protein A4E72_01578 [Syntrophus sp. PtaU1.Bin208]
MGCTEHLARTFNAGKKHLGWDGQIDKGFSFVPIAAVVAHAAPLSYFCLTEIV